MPQRKEAHLELDSPVTCVTGCAASRAQALEKLGIRTVRDLVTWYPHRYIDLTQVVSCAEASIGQVVTVSGRLEGVRQKQPRGNLHIIEACVVDSSGSMGLVWFRQPWLINKLHPGDTIAATGKVAFSYGMKQISSPVIEVLSGEDAQPKLAMVPVHRATDAIKPSWIRRLVSNALVQLGDIHDPLPVALRVKRALQSRKAALRFIHFPQSAHLRDEARRRLAYEELLRLQLLMMTRRNAECAHAGYSAHVLGECTKLYRRKLPFELTDEQEQAVSDICADMCASRPMNRMLLGDVGTGKTAVAGFALALAADSGSQAAMMAPTEVLARQYAGKLGPILDACGVRWATLTGATDAVSRKDMLAKIAAGELDVVFGTHALIEPDVIFKNMSLAIIDEQHRFGVGQRSALRAKGAASDLLVMTATPIPRTLALALYGDLDTSFIRKRPASRPPVATSVVSRSNRRYAYEAIREQLSQGHQAYVVCPLVGLTREQRQAAAQDGSMQDALSGQGEVADLKAAQDEAAYLSTKVFAQWDVGLLTGRMPATQKQRVMDDFAAGRIDVLVSTTVIEVGIDVPNATVMMIEDADRFGLSQLHQLRGRVGRGDHPGQLFLVADPGKDDDALKARLQAMTTCDDGFKLAELDLVSRREGDVMGTRQHGAAHLRLANVIDDAQLVEYAHEDARAILAADPYLSSGQNALLAKDIEAHFPDIRTALVKGA